MPERPSLQRILILFAALAIASYALYFKLSQAPFLRGSDAYYYALQIDHWARTGHVKIPDSCWIFPMLGLIQRAGASTEAVLRGFLIVSLLGAAAAFYFSTSAPLLRRSSATLWVILSPTLLFTAIEFPKMFVVVALMPLWSFTRERRRLMISLAAMAIAVWAHRSALALIVLFAFGHWLDAKLENQKYIWLALFVLAAVTFIFGDRSLVGDLHRFIPKMQLAQPGLFSLLERESLPMAVKIELTVSAAGFVFFFFQKAFRGDSATSFQNLLPGLVAFLPFGSTDVFSVGERLTLFLPMLVLMLVCERPKTKETIDEATPAYYLLIAAGVVGGLMPQLRLELSHPASLDPDLAQIRQVTKTLAQVDIPLLIANKNMAYYYKYALHREAFPYEPEDHWNKQRLWRLVYRIGPEELWPYLSNDCRNELLHDWPDYLLVREDCWSAARSKLDPEQNSDLYARAWNHVWNPSEKRPAFLYPKHKDDAEDEFPALPRQ